MIKSDTQKYVPEEEEGYECAMNKYVSEVVAYEWAKNNSSQNFCKCCNSHWCKSLKADTQITGSSKALKKLKSMHKKRSKSDPISYECFESYYYESDYYDDF